MRVFIILSAAIFSLVASSASAGFYVEPFVGYIKGEIDSQTKAALGGTSAKMENTGLAYGAGLGWIFPNKVRVGADVELSNQEIKNTTTSVTSKVNVTSAYVIVGYEFEKEIIAYLGGGQSSSVDDQTPKTTSTGTTLKAGAYKELVNHVAFGAEAMLHTWVESTTEGSASVKIADVYEKYNSTSLHLFFRFPFEIGGK
ncbi:MAG: outer membrane beta-barrel protein [Bdellovibrionota bacterium]